MSTPERVLSMRRWATVPTALHGWQQLLAIDLGERSVPMAHSPATGEALVSNGLLGIDVIRLAGGTAFAPHTHPGDHILVVVGGRGTVTYDGVIYPTEAGEVYLVPGDKPHAVGAITDHVILAVGAPHKPVDAHDRMTPVPYQAVLASMDRLHCLLCNVTAHHPEYPHNYACPHCPCARCVPIPTSDEVYHG